MPVPAPVLTTFNSGIPGFMGLSIEAPAGYAAIFFLGTDSSGSTTWTARIQLREYVPGEVKVLVPLLGKFWIAKFQQVTTYGPASNEVTEVDGTPADLQSLLGVTLEEGDRVEVVQASVSKTVRADGSLS